MSIDIVSRAIGKQNTTQLSDIASQQKKPLGYNMKNYCSKIGKVMENFKTVADWTPVTGTITENVTEYKRGKKAIKIQAPASGSSMTKIISTYMGNTNRQLRFWVYCHDTIDKVSDAVIYLTSIMNFSVFFSAHFQAQIRKQGWNYIILNPNDWTATGAETWENTFVRLRLRVDPVAGQTCSLTFDAMDYDVETEPRVVFTFDDGLTNVHTNAYPIMEAAGIKGVTYVKGGAVGTDDAYYMNLSQLYTLYNAGWDVGNHSWTHPHFLTMTEVEILAEIVDTQNWLLAQGFTRSAKHFAIPNGEYDADVEAAIANSGALTVRSSIVDIFYPETYSLLHLPAKYLVDTTTLATAIDWIDTATFKGQTVILMFHGIVETPISEYQWSIANFTALVDYIVQRNVRVVTMSEWYDGLNL